MPGYKFEDKFNLIIYGAIAGGNVLGINCVNETHKGDIGWAFATKYRREPYGSLLIIYSKVNLSV